MSFESLQHLLPKDNISQDAQDIINRILTTLRETIENLEKVRVPRRYLPMRAINLARNDFKTFTDITTKLPYNFEFICFESIFVTSSKKREIRADFEKARKKAFLKLLECDPDVARQLLDMGLNPQQIDSFYNGKPIFDINGKPIAITVDHIHDINFGGTNDPRNLCVIPDDVNTLKEQFVRIQQRVNPDEKRKVTFAPRDGIKVPFINGGFKVGLNHTPKEQRERVAEERYKEFLGLK
jgi:hypothetical protein